MILMKLSNAIIQSAQTIEVKQQDGGYQKLDVRENVVEILVFKQKTTFVKIF